MLIEIKRSAREDNATRAQERHASRSFSAVSAIFICVNSLIGQSGEEMHIRTDHHDCLRMFEFNNLQKKKIQERNKIGANSSILQKFH